jgi:hypothetical protein
MEEKWVPAIGTLDASSRDLFNSLSEEDFNFNFCKVF